MAQWKGNHSSSTGDEAGCGRPCFMLLLPVGASSAREGAAPARPANWVSRLCGLIPDCDDIDCLVNDPMMSATAQVQRKGLTTGG